MRAFQRLAARTLATTQVKSNMDMDMSDIQQITVLGAGIIGHGIGQVSAQCGIECTLVDLNDGILEKAEKNIDKSLTKILNKKFDEDQTKVHNMKSRIMNRISYSTDMIEASEQAELVIETVDEDLELKQRLFKELDEACMHHTILTSDTSSLNIAEIAKYVSEERREKVAGLHFFNPVAIMKLIEIVKIDEWTSDWTVDELKGYCNRINRVSVMCQDTPGFLVNRLIYPYIFEAIRLHERGNASIKDIDNGMKLGADYPMGPFVVADLIGLDVCKQVLDGWRDLEPKNPLFQESPLLNEMVSSGKIGRKAGHGFYDYKKRDFIA